MLIKWLAQWLSNRKSSITVSTSFSFLHACSTHKPDHGVMLWTFMAFRFAIDLLEIEVTKPPVEDFKIFRELWPPVSTIPK